MGQSLQRSVAVIGSGVAGLTAAYILSGRGRVTLYEANTRLGRHAHTHVVDRGDGSVVGVDWAFLVHNDRTYPTLCRLFSELGVLTQESEMSMSVRTEDTGLECAGAPAHRGVVMDRGLWAWTRHPNYFGDACVWWGLWLTTITGRWALTTVLSPLLMAYFLVCTTRRRAHREVYGGPLRFRRIPGTDIVFRPASA